VFNNLVLNRRNPSSLPWSRRTRSTSTCELEEQRRGTCGISAQAHLYEKLSLTKNA
jgi:CO dehydrogenase/acetyl-CoA synthase alpha subunit